MFNSIFLLLSNLAVSLAFAAEVTPPIFKIESNGQQAYLLGTFHTGVSYRDFSQQVKDIAAAADSLVVETDVAAAAPLMKKAVQLGAENSLKDQLTPQEWELLYARLAPMLGANAGIIDQLHPLVACLFYTSSTLQTGSEPIEPIDTTLMKNAAKAGKSIFYFEEPQDQIDTMLKWQTIIELKQALAGPIDNLQAESDALMRAYISGDLKGIESSFDAQTSDRDMQILIIDRNIKWIKKFDGLFPKPGTELFAVGAGHLGGNYGLLQMLRDRGYTVTQL